MIECLWSPTLCIFEKKKNKKNLFDKKYDTYEKTVTFDGPEFYSQNEKIISPTVQR